MKFSIYLNRRVFVMFPFDVQNLMFLNLLINFASLAVQNASSEESDQIVRMRRLAESSMGAHVRRYAFVTLRLICSTLLTNFDYKNKSMFNFQYENTPIQI